MILQFLVLFFLPSLRLFVWTVFTYQAPVVNETTNSAWSKRHSYLSWSSKLSLGPRFIKLSSTGVAEMKRVRGRKNGTSVFTFWWGKIDIELTSRYFCHGPLYAVYGDVFAKAVVVMSGMSEVICLTGLWNHAVCEQLFKIAGEIKHRCIVVTRGPVFVEFVFWAGSLGRAVCQCYIQSWCSRNFVSQCVCGGVFCQGLLSVYGKYLWIQIWLGV